MEGGRIAQIEPVNQDLESGGIPFPIAPPLEWIDCDDAVTTQHTWNGKAFIAPTISPATPAQLQAIIETALQSAMDAQARVHGYDDLRAAITYRGSSNPTWAHEGDVFFAWRDAVWEKAISVLQDVQAGKAKMPTPDEALAMMPPLVF